ncbi:ISL3 family transposase [Actinomadura bangladeshensis]|uniref:ISL3 family transposase n=1 Tax=Actinomadura bangladeshensis TaxID=453573 RepID=A0A4R4P5U2_9ACTN|nr:ISL3 family transposase [Actinomadura bangladeshensis]
MRLKARTATAEAACPGCGTWSRHRHSRYERRLSDTAVGGSELLIDLQVHRFLCRNDGCGKKTFAEQVPGLTVRYGRRSVAAAEALRAIALALAGRPGARLAGRLVTAVSRMTLLRLIRRLPEPSEHLADQAGPRILGVDDFALRRGRIYGTILIDITTGKPVDVLPDRTADTLADWLRAHPGVEIVCRDRAGAYADGISRGAPEAIQVADRWHLWRNLGDAVERTVTRHRRQLHALVPGPAAQADDDPVACAPPPSAPPSAPSPPPSASASIPVPQARRDRVAARTRQRHAAVHALIDQGRSRQQIARELGLSRNTVRRFARAADPDDLLVHTGTGRRTKELAAYDAYLRRRWGQGCTNAAQLYQELRSQGYRGAATTVRQYLQPWRTAPPAAPSTTPPAAPVRHRATTVRQATGWFLRHPAHLDPGDQHRLDALCAASPQLNALRTHVSHFAEIMMNRGGRHLEAWMTGVLGDDLPELHSFVTGLRRDQDAVTAGLTLPYSSGPVEGHVNRIKTIKRQMFGRAGFDLLRKRILLTD